MRYQTRLQKRGGKYYFRARVPADLLLHYSPKAEIKFSLRTRDHREAVRLVNLHSARLDAEFEEKRRQTFRLNDPHVTITHLSDAEIKGLGNLWLRWVLETDDMLRMEGISDEEFKETAAGLSDAIKSLQDALARGNTKIMEPALAGFMDVIRVDLQVDAETRKRLIYQYLKSATQAEQLKQERLQGQVVDVDKVVPEDLVFRPTAARRDPRSLTALFEKWRDAVKDRRPKTVADFKSTVDRFAAFINHKPAADIKRADVKAYRDHLLQNEGLDYRTVEKKLALLCAVFQLAVDDDELETNPAARIKVPKPRVPKISRLPYSLEDMQRILSSPLYTKGERPRGGAGEAAVWLPLLGMFTGAREEELCQLMVDDIQKAPGLGYYLSIADLSEEQQVKTPQSRRRVPMHSGLVRAGLIRYVEKLRNEGVKRLFPHLKPDVQGKWSGNWSKWWGRYARQVIGITDRKKVFHSYRHSFTDACDLAGIEEKIQDILIGHVGQNRKQNHGKGQQRRGYGSLLYPLPPLFGAMRRITFPGVKIPRLMQAVSASKAGGDAKIGRKAA